MNAEPDRRRRRGVVHVRTTAAGGAVTAAAAAVVTARQPQETVRESDIMNLLSFAINTTAERDPRARCAWRVAFDQLSHRCHIGTQICAFPACWDDTMHAKQLIPSRPLHSVRVTTNEDLLIADIEIKDNAGNELTVSLDVSAIGDELHALHNANINGSNSSNSSSTSETQGVSQPQPFVLKTAIHAQLGLTPDSVSSSNDTEFTDVEMMDVLSDRVKIAAARYVCGNGAANMTMTQQFCNAVNVTSRPFPTCKLSMAIMSDTSRKRPFSVLKTRDFDASLISNRALSLMISATNGDITRVKDTRCEHIQCVDGSIAFVTVHNPNVA